MDLFCGAGGFSLGFGDAGFELLLANDIWGHALDTFKYNLKVSHPDTPQHCIVEESITDLYKHLGQSDVIEQQLGDISITPKKEVEQRTKAEKIAGTNQDSYKHLREIKEIDVLIGGPPCQGFSMIGRSKRGSKDDRAQGFIDDPRNQLFKYYLKFVERYNPKIVVIENVKGLASAAKYRDVIEESLSITGNKYDVSSEILNAADFGVPQNRERIFFIGVRNDLIDKFTAKSILTDLSNLMVESQINLSSGLKGLPPIIANPKPNNYKEDAEIPIGNSKSFGENTSKKTYRELVESTSYSKLINSFRGKQIIPDFLFNHKARYHNERDLFIYQNLVAGKYLNDPSNEKALSKVTYGTYVDEEGKVRIKGFADKYFKLNPETPSKTILAHLETDGNSYVHPGKKPRSISPREAARLQSFPDWYFFQNSTRAQFRQIGNAVAPLLARNLAQVINKKLQTL